MRRAKPQTRSRSGLLAPLAQLAALLLLLETWLWDIGSGIVGWIAASPPLRWLEARIRTLPPWAALCAFALPGLVLLPVKLFALFAITQGHTVMGLICFIAAKLTGTAVAARIYVLTLPALLTVGWFARWHGGFIDLKDRSLAVLTESDLWRQVRASVTIARRSMRRMLRHAGRQPGHLRRVLGRLKSRSSARSRLRRQDKTGTQAQSQSQIQSETELP